MQSARVLFGREETPPRWKFCVSYVNGNLGNAVGAMFVEKYFDENSKHDVSLLNGTRKLVFHVMYFVQYCMYFRRNSRPCPFQMEDLTDGIQHVFKELVTEADWLTNATKVQKDIMIYE